MPSIFCNKCFDTVSTYTQMDCGHQFCHSCIDPSDQYFQCFKCKANRRRYVDKLNIITEAELNNCILCQEKVLVKEFGFSCAHPFCKECLSTFWVSQIKEGYFRMLDQFGCPHCAKSHHMAEDKIQKLLPIHLFMLIKDRELTKDLFSCPSCEHIFLFDKNGINYNCPSCACEICPVCLQIHEGEERCKIIDYKEIFQNVLHQDVRYCPHCQDPYMKDQQCDHVTCLSCRQEFCYFCMCDYAPIRAHGNTRHRADCRNFTFIGGMVVEECLGCAVDCRPPAETMEEFVERNQLYVNPNYRNFDSAPGWAGGQDEEDMQMGFFD